MRSVAFRVAVSLVRLWTRLYTWRLPPSLGDERRAEIDSDLWEFEHDADASARLSPCVQIVGRLLLGVPHDIAWRAGQVSVTWSPARAVVVLTMAVATLCALLIVDIITSPSLPAAPTSPQASAVFIEAPPPPPPPGGPANYWRPIAR